MAPPPSASLLKVSGSPDPAAATDPPLTDLSRKSSAPSRNRHVTSPPPQLSRNSTRAENILAPAE